MTGQITSRQSGFKVNSKTFCFFSTIFLIVILTTLGCKKNNSDVSVPEPRPQDIANKGLLLKVYDSLNAEVNDTFVYNLDKRLVKFRASHGGGSANGPYVDTFIYNNNLLVRSQYNLGVTINFTAPYAKTEYEFQNSILSSSKYYLGNTNLITSSIYTFNISDNLVQVTQTKINNTLIGLESTYTARFEYDGNSNLTKVFYKQNPYPEYLRAEYLNYDNKINPYYKLPWLFDYNFYYGEVEKISKNNVGKINIYSSYQGSAPSLSSTTSYTYEYNLDGKVIKRRGGLYGTKYFIYK